MNIFRKPRELIVIRNPFEPQEFEQYKGHDLDALIRQAFPQGINESVRFYHGNLLQEVFAERDKQGVDKLLKLDGRIYAVIKPMGLEAWVVSLIVSVVVSVAVSLLMPMPNINQSTANQPPSPNNSLAQRSNRQRLGGRVPDIFGIVWSFPDLIAPTYSVYINHDEVEFSYMCVGRGHYNVQKAYDDTTPIQQINGATALVFEPNKTVNDAPQARFGSDFTADEASFSRFVAKRYTAVNGQTLAPPDNYLAGNNDIYFKNPNIITTASSNIDFTAQFVAGARLTVENASKLKSGNGANYANDGSANLIAYNNLIGGYFDSNGKPTGGYPDCYDPTYYSVNGGQNFKFTLSANGSSNGIYGVVIFYDSNKNVINIVQSHHVDSFTSVGFNAPNNASFYRYSLISKDCQAKLSYAQAITSNTAPTYDLNGVYTISSVTKNQITLSNPASVAVDWNRLNANADFTQTNGIIISTQGQTLWQGWFYTDLPEHTDVMLNIKATNGLYWQHQSDWEAAKIYIEIESELVDSQLNPIAGTTEIKLHEFKSRSYDKYAGNEYEVELGSLVYCGGIRSNDDDVRRIAAKTIMISNSHFQKGNRLRWRIRRKSRKLNKSKGITPIDEVKITDFYGIRLLSASDSPSDVTTVYTKTKATEGALAVKERKLRLLLQRYVKNWQDNDNLILSNRADDIIYHIARDEKLANLQSYQIDMAQIKAEIDAVIDNFKTPLCAEFCYTFDDNNVSAEEMLQIVSKAVFSTCYRFNNQLKLLFERSIPVSVAIFNSHNILPDTFDKAESFGNEYDGVIIDYVEPVDDATMTINTSDSIANPKKDKIMGVRNKVQAHMHMMRIWNKLQFSYKSCEFTGGDESGIVIRSNRITVADQSRADVQQGSVENLEMIDNKIVLSTSNRVSLDNSSHTLFVQTVDGNVDAIPCGTLSDYQVVLSRLPSGQIAIGHDNVVNAVYQIVKTQDRGRDAYLVSEKSPEKGLTNRLTCINYDDRYYQNDSDYRNNQIPTTPNN